MLPYEDIELPDEAVLDKLFGKTKGQLFFKKGAGFLGSLLCNHRFIWDTTCSTAWTDGATIGWNPKFFFWLTPEERVTVLAHEIYHTGFDHMGRLGSFRCPDIFNQAADFVINLMLKKFGFVFGDKLMSINPCLDEQYVNMSTEEVYDLLPKPPSGGNTGDPSSGGGSGTPAPGDSPLGGDVREPLDQKAKDAIIGKLVKARQMSQLAKEAGVVPGETEIIIDNFLRPILPWEVLLQRFFTNLSQDDYSWRRPSRRHEHEYLPTLLGENGLEHLIYYFDVSGSVSDGDVLRCSSELKHIHEDLRPKKLTLVTFDTEIQDELTFTDDMPFEKIVLHGRGGTSLHPVYEHIKTHRPTAAVVFSDLYCYPMAQDPQVPVLWVVVGNKRAHPAFGQVVHISNE